MSLTCSTCSRKVVEESILFKDPLHDLMRGDENLFKKGKGSESKGVGRQFLDLEIPPFSPSARRHHTYGWLAGEVSVVGNDLKSEEWRIGRWEHVDVRRYVMKSFCQRK